jgi:ribokinase
MNLDHQEEPPHRIAVLGSANIDLILPVPHLPHAGETVLAIEAIRGLGGKGANQAVAAARSGADVSLLGAVGDDADGSTIQRQMRDEGIDADLLRLQEGLPTGLAVVSVSTNAENSIIVASGANATITALTELELTCVKTAAVLLLQLETPLSAVIQAAAAAGGTVILNAAPALSLPEELLRRVDVLVVNESEARTQSHALTQVPIVVTTLGPNGALVQQRNRPDIRVPGHDVVAVDTTGAGDTFCGVLASGLATGMDLAAAVRRANVAAALSVQRHGAQASMPTRAEIERASA